MANRYNLSDRLIRPKPVGVATPVRIPVVRGTYEPPVAASPPIDPGLLERVLGLGSGIVSAARGYLPPSMGGTPSPGDTTKPEEAALKTGLSGRLKQKPNSEPQDLAGLAEEEFNDLHTEVLTKEKLRKRPYIATKGEKFRTVGIGHLLDGSSGSRAAFQKVFQNDPTLQDNRDYGGDSTDPIEELYDNLSEGRGQLTEAQAHKLFKVADLPRKINKARAVTNYDDGRRKKKKWKALKDAGKTRKQYTTQKHDPIRDNALFDSLPADLKKNIISATFRGSWPGSPGTRRLLLQGRPQDAAVEFLNNAEYKKAVRLGKKSGRRGIISRMDQVRDALNEHASEAEN